ncbi:DGQHR domain-containing protein [Aliarcobacter butzleri]|uniref:DGQHR domain-containing protein n=1 Tax=Aliarcobacter butzleri TaxID=28197 RepID=UPI003AF4F1D2
MSNWFTFPCQIIKQAKNAPEIAVFSCDAYDLFEVSTVSRLEQSSEGYQRMINKKRQNDISKYIDTPGALIPTSIVCAAEENEDLVKIVNKKQITGSHDRWTADLKIRTYKDKKPCLIIDGQHRLYGITGSSKPSFPISVNLLLNAKTVTQVLHFIIINNKATRIGNALINELKGNITHLSKKEDEELEHLLSQLGVESITDETFISLLNDEKNTFGNILDFKTNKMQLVSSQTLKTLIRKSRTSGFLSKIDNDDENQIKAYNYMWEAVKKSFQKRWDFELGLAEEVVLKTKTKKDFNSEKKILHSGAIDVMGSLLDEELKTMNYRKIWESDISKIYDITLEILSKVPKAFWEDINIDNTSKGKRGFREKFEDAILN